jgi:hypothetical protein
MLGDEPLIDQPLHGADDGLRMPAQRIGQLQEARGYSAMLAAEPDQVTRTLPLDMADREQNENSKIQGDDINTDHPDQTAWLQFAQVHLQFPEFGDHGRSASMCLA